MDIDCPACQPITGTEICENCRRVLTRGICMVIFHVMECGFGVAIALSAVTENYVALAVFALASSMSIFLVVK
jgi:hypothetical protein